MYPLSCSHYKTIVATFSTDFEKIVDKMSPMRYHSIVDNLSITRYGMKGGVSMTDVVLLKQKIEDSGLKNKAIAEKLGISRTAWYYKRNNITPITAEEISLLCDVFHITSLREKERIFFARM